MFISLIIPCHNEALRLEKTLKRFKIFFDSFHESGNTFEFIFVENGSTDETLLILKSLKNIFDKSVSVSIVQSEKGKGAAIKKGLAQSRGCYSLICDADNSTDISYLKTMMKIVSDDSSIDVINSSRRLPESQIENGQNFIRKLGGIFFHYLVRKIFDLKLTDTQNGFKLLKTGMARKIYNNMITKQWVSEVEFFVLVERCRFSIKEIPIKWINDHKSNFKIKDAVMVFIDLYRIWKRYKFPKTEIISEAVLKGINSH